MRTITEMQQEIKNISSSLEELSKDIMKFEKKDGEKPSEDVFERIKIIGKRNPIVLHPLICKDEIIKQHYLVLLASSIIISKGNGEDAWLLLQRIACAANIQAELSEVSIDASCLNYKQIDEFTYSIISNNISEIFSFDLLLIHLLSNDDNAECLQYISELLQLVNVDKKTIKDLSILAKIVAEQNSTDYITFSKKSNSLDLPELYCYLKTIHSGIMANNKSLLWVNENVPLENLMQLAIEEEEKVLFGTQKTKKINSEKILLENLTIDLQEEIKFSGAEIKFENCKINLKDKSKIKFESCGKVILKDCIIDSEGYPIVFTECESINLENSTFKGNDERKCFYATNGSMLKISGCSFIDFSSNEKKEYQYGAYFCCFQIEDISSVQFNNSIFRNCQAKHWERGEANSAVGGIYGTRNIVFQECEFYNCKNRVWKYGQTWEDRGHMFQFDKGVKANFNSCKFENCVKQVEENR